MEQNERIDDVYLEGEILVEDGVEGFAMDFGFELLFLVRQEVDFDVRIGGATHVQGRQFFRLMNGDDQVALIEVIFQFVLKFAQLLFLLLLALDRNVLHVVRQFVHIRLDLFQFPNIIIIHSILVTVCCCSFTFSL